MKSSKKKLIIALVSVVLIVALAVGGVSYAVKNSGKPVKVAPVSNMNNGGFWDNNSDLAPYGNVTTNLNQEIPYNENLIITDIYVQEGDTVRVGDPLIAYDTTLVSLELEMKEMEVEGIGLNIQNVQAELDQLRKTKPVASSSPSSLSGMALAAGEASGGSNRTGGSTTPADSSDDSTPAETTATPDPGDSTTPGDSGTPPTSDSPDETRTSADSGESTTPSNSEDSTTPGDSNETTTSGIPDSTSSPSNPGGTTPPEAPELTGKVYSEITELSEPYCGDGSKEHPFRYYIYSADQKPVTVSHEYLALCFKNHTYSVFDIVDDPAHPTVVISSFQVDWDYIAQMIDNAGGGDIPEELRDQTVYRTVDAEIIPYNLEEIGGIPAGDGTRENPYRIFCTPDVTISRSFLEIALDSQLVFQFDVTDSDHLPNYILYSWTLDGAEEETLDDPGMEIPGIEGPGIEIPTGPTKEELASQIKEKEETLKTLELNKRTAELELKQLKKQMDDGVIASTVDGTVKSVLDEDTAKLEGSPLIRVTGEEGFYITGSVTETALDKLEKGMAVTVSSWNTGMTYEAEITGISNSPSSNNYYGGNPNMSYYPFTAVIRGDAELSNGEGVDLSVEGLNSSSYNPDAIYLSQAFVREEGARYYVYKKGEDDKLTKQYVDVGKIIYGSLEITSGLEMDDEIAFPYGRDVKEGAKTEPTDSLYDYGY